MRKRKGDKGEGMQSKEMNMKRATTHTHTHTIGSSLLIKKKNLKEKGINLSRSSLPDVLGHVWTALSAAAIWRSLSGSTVQSLCTCGSVNALDPPPGCQTCECFHFEEADEESGRWIQWIQLRSFQPSDRTRTDVLTPARTNSGYRIR